ncbi:MAG: S8 family serine peptidase [Verrucomicrobiota bacterium]|nr:S8 family serine peptidase [Verrucomicrobiota bacterium]
MILFCFSFSGFAEENLIRWHPVQNKLDAAISDLSVNEALSRLASATRWKIYVQPGLQKQVNVKFQGVSSGEGLRLLLGSLNYALLPGPNGTKKLFIFDRTADQATQFIKSTLEPSKARDWLKKEVIISLSPDSTLDPDKLAKELGGKVVGRADEMKSYRLQFESEEMAQNAREKFAEMEDVRTDHNFAVEQPIQRERTLNSQGLPQIQPSSSSGEGVRVAIIDTALQPLEGQAASFLGSVTHVAGQPGEFPAEPTHATSMFHTFLNTWASLSESGASPLVIDVIDVYGANVSSSTFEVAKGLQVAIKQGADIVNMSLGGDGQSLIVDELIALGTARGTMFLGAAGNAPTGQPTYPAANPLVLAVTTPASYANKADFVDLVGPARSMIEYGGQKWIISGTSPGTASMSALAAYYRSKGLSPTQVEGVLRQTHSYNAGVK